MAGTTVNMLGNTSDSNMTTEGTEDESEEVPNWALALAGVTMGILVLTAVVGNLVVIISYFRDKQLQTAHNVYIVNLATSDLLTGAISMTFYADVTLRRWDWIFGRAVCKLWCVNDYTMCLVSVLLMILLAWDTVLLLRDGVKYMKQQTMKVAKIKAGVAWCIALVVYVPIVTLYDVVRGHSVIEEGACESEFFADHVFSMISAVFELIIPLIVIIVLNTVVFLAIRKRLNMFDKKVGPKETTFQIKTDLGTVSSEIELSKDTEFPGTQKSTRPKGKRSKYSTRRDLRAAKFLTVLVAAFLVCWAPYTITNFVAALCDECAPEPMYELFAWLLWSKACVNPFLYASQSQRFRSNFVKLLPFLKLCIKSE